MTAKTVLYRCEELGPKLHRVRKYDVDFHLMAEYLIKGNDCDCPAHKPWCRHRAMVAAYEKGQWPAGPFQFYDWDQKRIVSTIGEPG